MLLFSNVREFPTVPIQLWLGAVVSVVSSIYRSAYMGAKKVLNLVMLIMGPSQPGGTQLQGVVMMLTKLLITRESFCLVVARTEL